MKMYILCGRVDEPLKNRWFHLLDLFNKWNENMGRNRRNETSNPMMLINNMICTSITNHIWIRTLLVMPVVTMCYSHVSTATITQISV